MQSQCQSKEKSDLGIISSHRCQRILTRYRHMQKMPKEILCLIRCQLIVLCGGVLASVLFSLHQEIYR